jgi:hypothetical protein
MPIENQRLPFVASMSTALMILRCPHCGRRNHHLRGDGGGAGPDYGYCWAHYIRDELTIAASEVVGLLPARNR